MWNSSVSFGILTKSSNWTPFYISDFQIPTEMIIKKIKMKDVEFMISLGLLKGSVGMN